MLVIAASEGKRTEPARATRSVSNKQHKQFAAFKAPTVQTCTYSKLQHIKHEIARQRSVTKKYRTMLGVAQIKASRNPIRSCAYASWVAGLWRTRANAHARYLNMLARSNRDFFIAGHLAAKVFHTTYQRLFYRASVEGGHGAWVPNRYGSGAGGWFQFMEGTYYGRSHSAFAVARSRGFPVPDKYNSWYSMLGQNLTAAYMFELGLECSGEGWAASC